MDALGTAVEALGDIVLKLAGYGGIHSAAAEAQVAVRAAIEVIGPTA